MKAEFQEYLKVLKEDGEIRSVAKAFPKAASLELKNTYVVMLNGNASYEGVKNTLLASPHFEDAYVEYISAQICGPSSQRCDGLDTESLICNNLELYNDPGSLCTNHIDRMGLPCAWEETNGSSDVVVGVIDVFLDDNHPDLAGKIISISGNCHDELDDASHGYSTAGGVAAIRGNGIHVAGAGGDTRIRGYCVGGGEADPACYDGVRASISMLANEAHSVDKVDVINISYQNTSISPALAREITEGGTPIVLAAYQSGHVDIANIPGVINVGQLNEEGRYRPYMWPTLDQAMDISVPILDSWRLTSPLVDGSGFGSANTSMAAPYVSGTIALMLAESPCMPPGIVERILKETGKLIGNVDDPGDTWYPELKDLRALDAYEAVLAAKNYQSETLIVGPGQSVLIEDDVRHFREIKVHPLGRLTILNSLIYMDAIDPNVNRVGYMTVMRGAKLIFKNSTVTSACGGEFWKGIKVWGNVDMPQPNAWTPGGELDYDAPVTEDGAGIVYFDTGTKIMNAQRVVSTIAQAVPYSVQVDRRGGLVAARGAQFINNRRVAEFLQYPRPSNTGPIRNKSRFEQCVFREATDLTENGLGITIWATDGITINNCRFHDFDWEAVVALDSEVNITGGCIFNKSEESNTADHRRSISAASTFPFSGNLNLTGETRQPNIFNYEPRNGAIVHFLGQDGFNDESTVSNNQFNVAYSGQRALTVTAVNVEGPTNLEFKDNWINAPNTSRNFRYGINLSNTSNSPFSGPSEVSCNFISDAGTGVHFNGLNSFTEVLTNDITDSDRGVWVRNGSINKNQGGPNRPAANCFENVGENLDVSSTADPFTYWVDKGLPLCEIVDESTVYEIQETDPLIDNCSPGGRSSCGGRTKTELTTILNDSKAILAQNPENKTAQLNYEKSLKDYSFCFRSSIDEKLREGNINAAVELASQIQEKDFQYTLFGVLMKTGRYADADNLLHNHTGTKGDFSDFKSVQEINLQALTSTKEYQLSSSEFNELDRISLKNNTSSAYAKSLLLYLEEYRYSVPLDGKGDVKNLSTTSKLTSSNQVLLTVSPNPTKGLYVVELGAELLPDINLDEINVLSLAGNIVESYSKLEGQRRYQIDAGGFQSGVYIVQVRTSNGGVLTSKLVVQK